MRVNRYAFTISPPLGSRTWPLMYELSSEAKKTKHGATSLGWPALPIGVLVPNFLISFVVNVETIKGVHMGPVQPH